MACAYKIIYNAGSQSEYWCIENGFRFESLHFACKVRDELAVVMQRLELPISEKILDENILITNVKRALLAGFFMQVRSSGVWIIRMAHSL